MPVPRTLEVISPLITFCAATSGSERFIIVLEKKVSASMTARKMMAAFLTQSLFFTFISVSIFITP